ncbi:diaminobutyrate acetyltransferase [Brachybacterium sp. GCM10030268]|uniref:diaminobutyrate acetyltransferase n=1 Tax=Brachybacterium sp. GCM10030268 TaxID=3273382 RepID=UPI00361F9FA0
MTTIENHSDSNRRTTRSSSPAADLTITAPAQSHGADIWRVARDSGSLDLNTSYAYLLLARDFAATSRVALHEGEVVGFVLGYLRPDAPERLFIWQIAVDESMRGQRVAARLLEALLEDLPSVAALETTITEDNSASQRLFASLAERHGASHTIEPLFEESHFPDEGHGAELLHVIGDLRPGA